VQIIEQTGFGVRSAVMTFERPGSAVKFVVVPMMHIASPTFYREVHRRLQGCDVIVAEGVEGTRTRIITLAYRLAGRYRREGLVQQSEALALERLGVPIVRPDVSAQEFNAGWSAIRWWLRSALLVLAPLAGLAMLVVGPLRLLGSNVALDDLPSADVEEVDLEEMIGSSAEHETSASLPNSSARPTPTRLILSPG
jgi:hypothetical protein